MLNVLTPLSVRPCASVLLVLFILPPKQFERFDPFDPFDPFRIFQAFDSYNYLSNSSVSIGSKCLPLHALQRVKINFFKLMGKPEEFEVFNSIELFGVYGEIKGVRSVRGKHSYNTLKEFIYLYSCTYRLWRLYEQEINELGIKIFKGPLSYNGPMLMYGFHHLIYIFYHPMPIMPLY